MKLVGKVPVETLDDERWTNIERRVVAGAPEAARVGHGERTSRRYLGFALAAAAAMAAGVIGWKLRAAEPVGQQVAEATPIAVHTDAQRSTLELGDATITSDASTVFTVTRPDGGVLVAMERGKVELEVAKRGSRPPLVVRAGDTDVIVVGTHFSVDYGDGHGDLAVRVTEGVVRVVHHGAEAARVAANQEWKTHGGLVAIAELPAQPHAVDNVEIDMGSGAPETPAHKPATPSVAKQPREASGSGSAAHRAADKPAGSGYVPLPVAIANENLEPALDVGEPTTEKAIARYREMAFGVSSGKFGDTPSHALYSLALVQYQKQGHTNEALETLDLYRRRFNRHPEYKAALWLRIRILCLQKVDDECRHAAYTYLHEAGDGDGGKQSVAERITIE